MALQEYKRSTDDQRLVQDKNVEVTTVFYPPHFETEAELEVGDSNEEKVGAIATFKDGEETKLGVYQGNGEWEALGSGGGDTIINIDPGTNIYVLAWTEEMKNKHGPITREPTVLVKAGADPPDTWTLLRSTVKYILDGNGELTAMNITISNLQAKIIIQ